MSPRPPHLYFHNGAWRCQGNTRMWPSLTDAGHAWCKARNTKLRP